MVKNFRDYTFRLQISKSANVNFTILIFVNVPHVLTVVTDIHTDTHRETDKLMAILGSCRFIRID